MGTRRLPWPATALGNEVGCDGRSRTCRELVLMWHGGYRAKNQFSCDSAITLPQIGSCVTWRLLCPKLDMGNRVWSDGQGHTSKEPVFMWHGGSRAPNRVWCYGWGYTCKEPVLMDTRWFPCPKPVLRHEVWTYNRICIFRAPYCSARRKIGLFRPVGPIEVVIQLYIYGSVLPIPCI